jgi:GNAT superfamily N-acetyltransferase
MTQPKSLVIRPIEARDEAAWRDLWRDYLAFYKTERSEEVYATTFARLLSGNQNEFSGFVAVLDGKTVGLVHYLFHRTCWAINDTCYLQDLYAMPEIRGKGLGRALIEAVYAAADTHGASNVYWLTQTFNTSARQLYDRIAVETPFIRYVRS